MKQHYKKIQEGNNNLERIDSYSNDCNTKVNLSMSISVMSIEENWSRTEGLQRPGHRRQNRLPPSTTIY